MDNGDGPPLSPAAQQTGEGSGDGQQPQAHSQKQQKHEAPPMYTLPGLEGEVGAAAAACAGLHRGRHTRLACPTGWLCACAVDNGAGS